MYWALHEPVKQPLIAASRPPGDCLRCRGSTRSRPLRHPGNPILLQPILRKGRRHGTAIRPRYARQHDQSRRDLSASADETRTSALCYDGGAFRTVFDGRESRTVVCSCAFLVCGVASKARIDSVLRVKGGSDCDNRPMASIYVTDLHSHYIVPGAHDLGDSTSRVPLLVGTGLSTLPMHSPSSYRMTLHLHRPLGYWTMSDFSGMSMSCAADTLTLCFPPIFRKSCIIDRKDWEDRRHVSIWWEMGAEWVVKHTVFS